MKFPIKIARPGPLFEKSVSTCGRFNRAGAEAGEDEIATLAMPAVHPPDRAARPA